MHVRRSTCVECPTVFLNVLSKYEGIKGFDSYIYNYSDLSRSNCSNDDETLICIFVINILSLCVFPFDIIL